MAELDREKEEQGLLRGHTFWDSRTFEKALVSSCTLRPEWTWFVIRGFRSISANVVVLIDRIIVLNEVLAQVWGSPSFSLHGDGFRSERNHPGA